MRSGIKIFLALGIATAMASPAAHAFVDTDYDGTPDDWEMLYGLNPNFYDSWRDLDGDTASNLSEYIAGTDPSDSQSVPALISVEYDLERSWLLRVLPENATEFALTLTRTRSSSGEVSVTCEVGGNTQVVTWGDGDETDKQCVFPISATANNCPQILDMATVSLNSGAAQVAQTEIYSVMEASSAPTQETLTPGGSVSHRIALEDQNSFFGGVTVNDTCGRDLGPILYNEGYTFSLENAPQFLYLQGPFNGGDTYYINGRPSTSDLGLHSNFIVRVSDSLGRSMEAEFSMLVFQSDPNTGDAVLDFDNDSDIDRDDFGPFRTFRNSAAEATYRGTPDPLDLDGDGYISSRDMRLMTRECTRPRCRTE